jgi:hypothetical protein
MSEKLDKVRPEVNVLAAFASTIVGAFAVSLPMAVAIVWVCSWFFRWADQAYFTTPPLRLAA